MAAPRIDIVAYDSPQSIEHFGSGGNGFGDPTKDLFSWWTDARQDYFGNLSIETNDPPLGKTSYLHCGINESSFGFYYEALVGPRLIKPYGVVVPEVNDDWEVIVQQGEVVELFASYRINEAAANSGGAFLALSFQGGSAEHFVTEFPSYTETLTTPNIWHTISLEWTVQEANTVLALPWIQGHNDASSGEVDPNSWLDIGNIQIYVDKNPDTLYISNTGFRFPYQRWT